MPLAIFEPTKIAYVDEANPTTNYGQNSGFTDLMEVRSENGANRRTFLQYDVSSLSASATILKAYIVVRIYAVNDSPGTSTFDGPRICTASWVYSTITWNNQPSLDTSTTVDTYGPPQGTFMPNLDARDIVQDWVDGTATNNGCYVAATSEDDGTGYGWTLSGRNTPTHYAMVVEYRDVDTLPATAVGLRRQFVGDAVTELEGLSTGAEWTLVAELDAGDYDLTADMMDGTRITRRIPFVMEDHVDIGSASFRISNPDGTYSPNRKSSPFYSRRVVGRNIRLDMTVAGQTVTIFSGKMRQPVQYPSGGFIEIEATQQDMLADIGRVLPQDNLALEIYAGNPADSIYEFLHNQAGVPDSSINLDTFVNAKAEWTSQGMEIGQATIERKASEVLAMMQQASLGQLYLDWKGRYSLHVWKPADPTSVTLTNFTLEEWREDFDLIRNYVTVYYGRGLTNSLIFPDDGSINGEGGFDGWGLRPMEIRNDMLRTPWRASMCARLYLQALADPIPMGRVSGGLNLMRHELGDAVQVVWDPEDINENCIVRGVSIYPAAGQVTLDIIKAHWTMPRRDFVLGDWVTQVSGDTYPGTSIDPMNDPVPSAITTADNNDGTMTATVTWTYTHGDAPAQGYAVWLNHSSTSGQPDPTTASYKDVKTVWGADNKSLAFQLPQDEYFTAAVSAFRLPSGIEVLSPAVPRVFYSNLVTSSSDPDWQNVQHSTRLAVTGDVKGGGGDVLLDYTSAILTSSLQLANQKLMRQISVGGRESVLSDLNLRSTDTTGANARIDWDQFTVTYGFGSVIYPASSKLSLTRDVGYHVYAFPAAVGSTSGYVYYATTVWEDLFSSQDTLYIGSIKTASTSVGTSGESGGGGGDDPVQ